MPRQDRPAERWRSGVVASAIAAAAAGVAVGLAIGHASASGAQQATPTFDAPVGLVVNYIRPAGTADFESVMTRLLEALADGDDAELRAQAEGWRIYRAREPGPNNQAVYIWLLDPAVGGGDYSVPQILAEAYPDEAQQLYETYNESFGAGQIWLNLDPLGGDGNSPGGAGAAGIPGATPGR